MDDQYLERIVAELERNRAEQDLKQIPKRLTEIAATLSTPHPEPKPERKYLRR